MEPHEPGHGSRLSSVEPMAVYIRHAHKAAKHLIDLGTARDRVLLANDIVAVRILDKGTGTFTLTFIFYDGTSLDLNQGEVSNGDIFRWDIQELRITNTAQTGLTLKLLTEFQREKIV